MTGVGVSPLPPESKTEHSWGVSRVRPEVVRRGPSRSTEKLVNSEETGVIFSDTGLSSAVHKMKAYSVPYFLLSVPVGRYSL